MIMSKRVSWPVGMGLKCSIMYSILQCSQQTHYSFYSISMEAEKGTFFRLRVGEWRRQAATVRDSRRQSATVGDSPRQSATVRRQSVTGGDRRRQFGDSRRQVATVCPLGFRLILILILILHACMHMVCV